MWIDRIVELVPGERIVAVKAVSLAEEHLHDHFPATARRPAVPVMPGSLLIEGMAQTAGILIGHAEGFREKVVLAKLTRAEIEADAVPGDTVRFEAVIQQRSRIGGSTAGTIELLRPIGGGGHERIAAGRIELLFSHLDQNIAGIEYPEHNFVFGDAFRMLLRSSGVDVPVG